MICKKLCLAVSSPQLEYSWQPTAKQCVTRQMDAQMTPETHKALHAVAH